MDFAPEGVNIHILIMLYMYCIVHVVYSTVECAQLTYFFKYTATLHTGFVLCTSCLIYCSVMYIMYVVPHTGPPPAPSGVMVDGVDDTSVTVVWRAVDDADRYTVTFTKTLGTSQQGLCTTNIHIAHVSVDVPSTSASIGVGQMLAADDTTMLRAYTTYSITVVAVSDVRGSSEDSEPVTVTTNQTSKS